VRRIYLNNTHSIGVSTNKNIGAQPEHPISQVEMLSTCSFDNWPGGV
jgi:hypothetical protein